MEVFVCLIKINKKIFEVNNKYDHNKNHHDKNHRLFLTEVLLMINIQLKYGTN
jgi:hypothetical protein